jgi:preprotein translocase subunit YajC
LELQHNIFYYSFIRPSRRRGEKDENVTASISSGITGGFVWTFRRNSEVNGASKEVSLGVEPSNVEDDTSRWFV